MQRNSVIAIGCVLTIGPAGICGQAVPAWKLGDGWHVKVELFSPVSKDAAKPDVPPAPAHSYDMHIVILGTETVGTATCWKVDFLIPQKKPPAGLTGRYRVYVDAADGWARRAFSFRNYANLPFEQFDTARWLTTIQDGYPIEVFPAVDIGAIKAARSPHTLTVSSSTETGLRVATLRLGDDKETEVRQTWKPGEKWWSEYERYRKGKLDLRARQVPRFVVKAPEPKPVPKVIIKQPTASKPTPTTYIDQTKNPLRGDARLLATVTVSLANPTVQDILNRFGKATDRTFTTQDDVDRATPIFAAINWVNVPVWSAMDQLARTSMTDGRWVQTADGYRLEGTSRLLRTPAASYAWVWWSVLAGGLLLGAGAVVLYRKRRAKPALAKG